MQDMFPNLYQRLLGKSHVDKGSSGKPDAVYLQTNGSYDLRSVTVKHKHAEKKENANH